MRRRGGKCARGHFGGERVSAPRAVASFFATFFARSKKVDQTRSSCATTKKLKRRREICSDVGISRVDRQSISRILYNGSHLSSLNVAAQVVATYPKGQRATSTLSYLVLLRVRFVRLADYSTTGRLLPCRFILTEKIRRFSFL